FDRFRDGETPVPVDMARLEPGERAALQAQLRPSPPIGLGAAAATAGATAMMDVSDGLALDARRLAEASDVTLALDLGALGDDPRQALAGGEDHALLATFPADVLAPGFRVIGTVMPAGEERLTADGRPIGETGWDP